MKLSRVLDQTLRILQWPLLAGVAVIVGNVLAEWTIGERLSWLDAPVKWVMIAFFTSNLLASLLGIASTLFTSQVKELRVTWCLSFLFAAAIAANVVLIPLFRHYVLGPRLSGGGGTFTRPGA